MQVVFLGSAYFDYVYAYAFDPYALGDLAYAAADQEQHTVASDQGRPRRPTGLPTLRWLKTCRGRHEQEAVC